MSTTQLPLIPADVAEEWIYIGFKPCGCAVAAMMEDPKSKDKRVQRNIDAAVADMVRDGLRVEHRRFTDGPVLIGRKVGCCRPEPRGVDTPISPNERAKRGNLNR